MRSAYHIRELDVYRLLQLRQPLDVFLSHDWPSRIADHGNKAQLCRYKKFLAKEVRHPVQVERHNVLHSSTAMAWSQAPCTWLSPSLDTGTDMQQQDA